MYICTSLQFDKSIYYTQHINKSTFVHLCERMFSITERVKLYFTSAHINRANLAESIGISRQNLSNKLRGKDITCEFLYELSKGTGHDFFQYFSDRLIQEGVHVNNVRGTNLDYKQKYYDLLEKFVENNPSEVSNVKELAKDNRQQINMLMEKVLPYGKEKKADSNSSAKG